MPSQISFFIVDLKNKIIPWVGSLEEMEDRYLRFKKRCTSSNIESEFEEYVGLIGGDGIDELAVEYMINKRKIPKRVLIQIERGDFGEFKRREEQRDSEVAERESC